ncbi:hypothetical protein F7725_027000 [Dissostichus mawsoni]|uniref:Uncharacterized protein n=1 Tax=Dissostichus mawsoni TaxID=36200 RepID=A0A7J5X8M7_DISMA|nr:hypothetical protein F7725_027000 [Dissostichus mawsoni]
MDSLDPESLYASPEQTGQPHLTLPTSEVSNLALGVIPAAPHDLHAVVSPLPRTWKANLKACHFVCHLFLHRNEGGAATLCLCVCVPLEGFSMCISLLRHTVFLFLLCTALIIPFARDLPISVPSGVYHHHLICASI